MRSRTGRGAAIGERASRFAARTAELARDPILAIDDKRSIVFANSAAERFFGYSSRELLGRNVGTLIVADDTGGDTRLARATALVGTARGAEPVVGAVASRKDGARVRVEVAWSPAPPAGTGDVAVVVIRDASAHAAAMEELRRGAERFEAMVNAVQDYAIFLIDPQGLVVSWNAGAERIKGWRADEIIGSSFKVFYTKDDVARHRPEAVLEAAARSGRTEDEGWRVRKDGERFYADVVVTALYDEVGQVCGFAKVTRDVTARWRADLRRRFFDGVTRVLSSSPLDHEGALRALADVAVREAAEFCLVDMIDEDGTLRRLQVSGARTGDADLVESLRKLPPTHPGFLATADVLHSGLPRLLETVAPAGAIPGSPDGEYSDLVRRLAPRSAVLVPIVARGRSLGVITLIRLRGDNPYDESDLRLLLEVGAKAGMHIDNACLYRTTQRALEDRDRVLAAVAHDLRGPLNSIVLRTALALRTLPSAVQGGDQVRHALTRVQQAAAQMEHLIRDLLDVVRMESGHLQAEVHRWAPVALVGAAADAAGPQADVQRVKLRTTLEPSLPLVAADRDRVLQVFSNLIGNALKFTPAGGTIELKGWAAGRRVWFAVSDTGPGIPAEQLPHIFERFWQLNRRDRRGLGLGLGICKWIVESHGGEIQVDSVPGQGTTFRFWLPVAE